MKLLCLSLSLFFSLGLIAQKNQTDTTSLAYFLKKGEFHGFQRSFAMSTHNQGQLKDFYALATNVGMSYQTASYKGFRFQTMGSFTFKIAATPMHIPDSITGRLSRYELGLFDLRNPKNTRDLGKLEHFMLTYQFKKSIVKLGRQSLQTPFINPQDGRIRPGFEEGIVLELNELKKLEVFAGYIWAVSPRSIMGWSSIGKSIGLYNTGRNADGSPSGYGNGNTQTFGVALLGVRYKREGINIQLWDQAVTNVFNTIYSQNDFQIKVNEKEEKLQLGVQATFQHALGNGGNAVDSMAYFNKNQPALILGGQIGFISKLYSFDLNFTRITASGRFIMPREWGREPFYTFISRERNEGVGDVYAGSFNFYSQFPKPNFRLRIAYGLYKLPDVNDVVLSKYSMPSYGLATFQLEKAFKGTFKGLQFRFLYFYKHAWANSTYGLAQHTINRVNMHHPNFIVNYWF